MTEKFKKIAIYTHDTFGLGHVTRCLHIARSLAIKMPNAAILMITGSPAMHAFKNLPANMDILKIPTVVKTGNPYSRPSHLPIGVKEVTEMRSSLIHQALLSFHPDVFLADNFPLGSKKELLPSLTALKQMKCRTIVGLRDIVDKPETVRDHWERDNIYNALKQYYDRILVYGVREVMDVAEAYQMPEEVGNKVHYCSYVTGDLPECRKSELPRQKLNKKSPFILVTVGGGGDGLPIIKLFLKAMQRLPEIQALVITGPLMGARDRQEIEAMAAQCQQVELRNFEPEITHYMMTSDGVIAMGGYNTIAEILLLQCKAIVIPRYWRYGEHANRKQVVMEYEQLLRAQALDKLGLVKYLHPDDLSIEKLVAAIGQMIKQNYREIKFPFSLNGAEAATEHIVELAFLDPQ